MIGARLGGALLAVAIAGACGGSHPAPVAPPDPDVGSGSGSDDGLAPGPDVDGPPIEERIAAIEHAMNDLAPVANQCWAAAAADDLHVAGRVQMLITVGADGHAKALADLDEPRDPVLIRCLADVLAAYAWAPPLNGQTVELPFVFTAPAMQNVIDRRLVPHEAQASVDIAVLLDELNTANAAISLLEVTIAPGATSSPRTIERSELWIFSTPAEVWTSSLMDGAPGSLGGAAGITNMHEVEPGDALWIPRRARMWLRAPAWSTPGATPVHAVVAIVPGGREGTARAGALPALAPPWAGGTAAPLGVKLPAAGGKRFPRPGGAATIRMEPGVPDKTVGKELSLLALELEAGAAVPAHVHAGETEVLYLLGGGGTMTVGGVSLPVTEYSVIQIPPGVEHAFTATAATTAIQIYTPAGPEQRFKASPPAPKKTP